MISACVSGFALPAMSRYETTPVRVGGSRKPQVGAPKQKLVVAV
jgi:hypothetical protein